jgi:hypothetical protein
LVLSQAISCQVTGNFHSCHQKQTIQWPKEKVQTVKCMTDKHYNKISPIHSQSLFLSLLWTTSQAYTFVLDLLYIYIYIYIKVSSTLSVSCFCIDACCVILRKDSALLWPRAEERKTKMSYSSHDWKINKL